ncbi:MAG: diphosphomevalonate decarboxylase [Myxococcota bacterium]
MTVAVAHPNIALVKYWGKRDARLNLPAVPSLSLTLGGWSTRTAVTWGGDRDVVVINGREVDDPKVRRVLDGVVPGRGPCRVESTNDFPTGAGLASSASGFAALVVAAAGGALDDATLSALARRGSGSACRSVFGGFVEWPLGVRDDGLDSVGVPIAPVDHWDVRMVVAVVSEGPKAVSSTDGMNRTQATSPFWAAWEALGPPLVDEARAAVLARDLERLGIAMERSTFAMHATMHAATPPLLYWQPATVALIHAVHALRRSGVGAWTTMDAGPQVKVLCLPGDVDAVTRAIDGLAVRTFVHGPGGPARIVPDSLGALGTPAP